MTTIKLRYAACFVQWKAVTSLQLTQHTTFGIRSQLATFGDYFVTRPTLNRNRSANYRTKMDPSKGNLLVRQRSVAKSMQKVCKPSLKQVIVSQMRSKLGLVNCQTFSKNLKLHKMNGIVQVIQITRSIDSNLNISIPMLRQASTNSCILL